MRFTVNCNAFVDLKNMMRVNNVGIDLVDYYLTDNTVEGTVEITGMYDGYDLKVERECTINNLVPFTVVFNDEIASLKEVTIKDFEYFEIANCGIETNFVLAIDYEEEQKMRSMVQQEIQKENTDEITYSYEVPFKEVELEDYNSTGTMREITKTDEKEDEIATYELTRDELNNPEVLYASSLDEETREEYKEEVSNIIDELLSSKLKVKYVKADNEILPIVKLEERRRTLKVCYYDEEKEINKICDKYDASVDEVMRNNQKYSFTTHRRIFLEK